MATTELGLPVKYIFTKGSYNALTSQGNTKIEGAVSLIIYQSGWVEIPLIPQNSALKGAQFDGRELPLYVRDEKYHFLAKGVGEHTLTFCFYVNNAKNGNTVSSSFTLPQTTMSNSKSYCAAAEDAVSRYRNSTGRFISHRI